MILRLSLIILLSLVASQSATAAPQCLHFAFNGEVKGQESLHQAIGMELSFRMVPSTETDGWTFEIGPDNPQKEEWDQYIYILTPPWRGRHTTMLDTAYATLAQDAVKKFPHDFWFVLKRKDSSRAYSALEQILWPKTDNAQDAGLDLLGTLPMGHGVLKILDSDIVPGTARPGDDPAHAFYGKVRRIAFSVEFAVPHDFEPARGLSSETGVCPATDTWPKQ